jgi:hypothetical protein
MIRGATAVWNSPNTMGTANAVYVEDSTYSGTGYMNENDGAAQSVFRFNTINSNAYLDAHMIETSTDASGVYHASRQIEGYDNTWPSQSYGYFNAINISGGTGMIFDNIVANDGGSNAFFARVEEYGAHAGPAYPPGTTTQFTTPSMKPIADQVGMGPYPQTAGAEPLYYFNNKHSGGTDLVFTGSSVAAGAISQYGSTFSMTSDQGSPYMLQQRVDYFYGPVGGSFPSTTDVGRGTKASMNASSPTVVGQGWWVTDEGSWNTKITANTSGQLYRWSGSAWVLYYTPYTYPHPLQGGGGSTSSSSMSGKISLTGKFQIK